MSGTGYSADFKKGLEAARGGDFATARAEWTPLARTGHVSAQYNLGVLYHKGRGVEPDPEKAIEWYRRAAAQGNAKAWNNLGVLLAEDDPLRAFLWHSLAAGRGLARADLGAEEVRDRVPAAKRKAALALVREWFERPEAARRGSPLVNGDAGALYRLATLALVPARDFTEAVRWLAPAAEQGHAPAQYLMGLLSEGGKGLPEDREAAKRWYALAADQGHPKARRDLAALTPRPVVAMTAPAPPARETAGGGCSEDNPAGCWVTSDAAE